MNDLSLLNCHLMNAAEFPENSKNRLPEKSCRNFRDMKWLVSILVFLPLIAQAQWPPEKAVPSPIMQSMHLPGGRFVPSTKRWNMVWADQLVPDNIKPARLKFAAEHFVATQEIW